METQSYLLFSLHKLLYGINTLQVQEIILLPEITPTIVAPTDIVGVINLRERIVPIMDLDLHFRRQPKTYQLSDRIIVLEHQNALLGIIVHQVHDVKKINVSNNVSNSDSNSVPCDSNHGSTCINKNIAQEFTPDTQISFTSEIAKVDDDLITLLNAEHLFQSVILSPTLVNPDSLTPPQPVIYDDRPTLSCTTVPQFDISLQEQAILRDRAQSLMQQAETQDLTGLLSFTVLKINDEYFGVETAIMREFIEVSKVTPIPCCPDHIVGNINLRGEIVTLLSLHSILNGLPSGKSRAIVVTVDDITAGITVDDVLDVTYLHPLTIKPLPIAIRAESQNYLKGTAVYDDTMMTILDLPKLLLQGELIVNEQA